MGVMLAHVVRWTVSGLVLVMGVTCWTGCDGGDDGPGGFSASPCGEQSSAVCTQACTCAESGHCKIVDWTSGSYSSLEFQDKDACVDYYRENLCDANFNPSAEATALFEHARDCGQCQEGDGGEMVLFIPEGCGSAPTDTVDPDAGRADATD